MTPANKPTPAPAIKVMLIDDHPTLLWGLEKLISSATPAMEVVATARSIGEALERLDCSDQAVPDVVLLDLDLDGRSGLDLLPRLLQTPHTRVLILTGERKQSVLDHAVHKGARGIVRKDASADQVLKAIAKTYEGELWLDRSALGRVFTGFMDPPAARQDPAAEKRDRLTSRERHIIQMIVDGQGASNKELAQRLFISEHTLRNHLTSIYQKLDVGNRLELYVYAVKHQLGTVAEERAA